MEPPGPGSGQITIAWCWPSNCIAATASNLCKEIDTNTELRLISAVTLLKDFLFVSNKNTETTKTCYRGEWGEGKSEQSSDNVYQSLDKQAFTIRDNGQSSLSLPSLSSAETITPQIHSLILLFSIELWSLWSLLHYPSCIIKARGRVNTPLQQFLRNNNNRMMPLCDVSKQQPSSMNIVWIIIWTK